MRPRLVSSPHNEPQPHATSQVSVQLPKFKEAGLHVAALYSRSQEKADQLCREHAPDAKGYTSVSALAKAGALLA